MANFSIENDCSLIPLDMSAVIQSVTSSFRTGAELKSGQLTKFSCQSARYFSRSFALTYSQYAFSRFQICVSSLAESCAISRSYSAAVRTANGDSSGPVVIFRRAPAVDERVNDFGQRFQG